MLPQKEGCPLKQTLNSHFITMYTPFHHVEPLQLLPHSFKLFGGLSDMYGCMPTGLFTWYSIKRLLAAPWKLVKPCEAAPVANRTGPWFVAPSGMVFAQVSAAARARQVSPVQNEGNHASSEGKAIIWNHANQKCLLESFTWLRFWWFGLLKVLVVKDNRHVV